MIVDFFRALWPVSYDGEITFWLYPTKKSHHAPLPQILALTPEDEGVAEAELREHNEQRKNVYFGLGLRDSRAELSEDQQGRKEDVIALPAFCLDLDIFDAHAHAAQNLPPTEADAYRILAGMPDPTLVVRSGFGLQIYWAFTKAVSWDPGKHAYVEGAYKRFVEAAKSRAAALGYHVDPTNTVQRVWRLPGFKNWKDAANPRLVELFHVDSAARYSVDELLAAARSGTEKQQLPPVPEPSAAIDPARSASTPIEEFVPTGGGDSLFEVVPFLIHRDNAKRTTWQKVIAGDPFAKQGEREVTLRDLTVALCGYRQTFDMSVDVLATLFAPSIAQMTRESNDPANPALTLDDVKTKLRTAKAYVKRREGKNQEANERILKSITRNRRIEQNAYGEDVVIEDDDAEPAKYTAEELQLVSLIQYKSVYYALNRITGHYESATIQAELPAALRDAWKGSSCDLYVYTDKGRKPKSLAQLLIDYGTVANNLIYDLTKQHSTWNVDTRTFFDATTPVRNLAPRFDPEIDKWIRLFAGEHVEKVLDWMATATHLSRPTCALYLAGPAGAGKSLFTRGISGLWSTRGPTQYGKIVGNFNEDLLYCPVVVADEYVPKTRDSALAQIRDMTATLVRTISKKYCPNASLLGAIRLIFCANNDWLFASGHDDLSDHDLAAVCKRILHVKVPETAAAYLVELGRDHLEDWVEKDYIARYCLWLAENRTVSTNNRFLVEGPVTSSHRQLIGAGGAVDLVREWLVRFVSNPKPVFDLYRMNKEVPRARIGNGFVYINVDAVMTFWNKYMHASSDPPPAGRVARILKNNAVGTEQLKNSSGSSGPRFHKIEGAFVLRLSQDTGIGDADKITERLQQSIEENEAPHLKLVPSPTEAKTKTETAASSESKNATTES